MQRSHPQEPSTRAILRAILRAIQGPVNQARRNTLWTLDSAGAPPADYAVYQSIAPFTLALLFTFTFITRSGYPCSPSSPSSPSLLSFLSFLSFLSSSHLSLSSSHLPGGLRSFSHLCCLKPESLPCVCLCVSFALQSQLLFRALSSVVISVYLFPSFSSLCPLKVEVPVLCLSPSLSLSLSLSLSRLTPDHSPHSFGFALLYSLILLFSYSLSLSLSLSFLKTTLSLVRGPFPGIPSRLVCPPTPLVYPRGLHSHALIAPVAPCHSSCVVALGP